MRDRSAEPSARGSDWRHGRLRSPADPRAPSGKAGGALLPRDSLRNPTLAYTPGWRGLRGHRRDPGKNSPRRADRRRSARPGDPRPRRPRPRGVLPVMEGKAVLFKEFGASTCRSLDATDPDDTATPSATAPTWWDQPRGHLGLSCFEIEERLQDLGSSTCTTTSTARRSCARDPERLRRSPSRRAGSSAAPAPRAAPSRAFSVRRHERSLILGGRGCSVRQSRIIGPDREGLDPVKAEMLEHEPRWIWARCRRGARRRRLHRVSRQGSSTRTTRSMARTPSPPPARTPSRRSSRRGLAAGAAVVGTASDFPNQVNGVLAFPGLFRGAEVGATRFTSGMKSRHRRIKSWVRRARA